MLHSVRISCPLRKRFPETLIRVHRCRLASDCGRIHLTPRAPSSAAYARSIFLCSLSFHCVNKSRDAFISRLLSLATCGNVKFVGMQRGLLSGSRDPVHRVLVFESLANEFTPPSSRNFTAPGSSCLRMAIVQLFLLLDPFNYPSLSYLVPFSAGHC